VGRARFRARDGAGSHCTPWSVGAAAPARNWDGIADEISQLSTSAHRGLKVNAEAQFRRQLLSEAADLLPVHATFSASIQQQETRTDHHVDVTCKHLPMEGHLVSPVGRCGLQSRVPTLRTSRLDEGRRDEYSMAAMRTDRLTNDSSVGESIVRNKSRRHASAAGHDDANPRGLERPAHSITSRFLRVAPPMARAGGCRRARHLGGAATRAGGAAAEHVAGWAPRQSATSLQATCTQRRRTSHARSPVMSTSKAWGRASAIAQKM
jgi:hypothetical protein